MVSSLDCNTPSRPRPYYSNTNDEDDYYEGVRRKRVVTFTTSPPSLSKIGDGKDHKNAVGHSRRTLLGSQMGTPHHCAGYPSSAEIVASVEDEDEGKMPMRLIESGAVRVHIATYTNQRRGADKHRSCRLIDQGAVRLQITRHTTPRKKVNATSRSRMMWPQTPSSSNKTMIPQTEMRPVRRLPSTMTATASKHGFTPSKQLSNAQFGGHNNCRAVCEELDTENEEKGCERDLPRTLRFE